MCFEGNLRVCLNQFFVRMKRAYAPWKYCVLAELPTAEMLLFYCLQCCSRFFMSRALLWSWLLLPLFACAVTGDRVNAVMENTSMTMRPTA